MDSNDAGAEVMLANWLLEEAGIPATNGDRLLVSQCIRLLAKRGGDLQQSAQYILRQAQMAELEGTPITIFWFRDRKYLQGQPPNPGAQQTTISEDEAYLRWQSMSPEFRERNPWGKV